MAERTPSINLIPRRRIEARQRRGRVRIWIIAMSAYVLTSTAVAGALNVAWDRAERRVTDELERLRGQASVVEEEIGLIQPQLIEAALQLKAGRAVSEQPDWSLLLALLGATRGEEIVLERVALIPIQVDAGEPAAGESGGAGSAGGSPGAKAVEPVTPRIDYRLEISGLGLTQQAVSRYLLRMEQTGLFDRVRPIDTSISPFGNERVVSFRAECLIGGGEAATAGLSASAQRTKP